jgi:multidrug efflux pump subunit AcrA (membrane-fusion protein)
MNEIAQLPTLKHADRESIVERKTEHAPPPRNKDARGHGGRPLGIAAALLLASGLGYGGWRDYTQRSEVAATAQQQRDFVPDVLVGQVRPSGDTIDVTLPGTTFAFEAANIFARANGYIEKRNVDIGDRV